MRPICFPLALAALLAAFGAQGAPASAPRPVSLSPGPVTPDAAGKGSELTLLHALACASAFVAYRLTEAENACSLTIAAMPDSPLGYKFRGYTYLLQHRYERAEPDFREAVRLDPDDPDIQAGFGQSLSGQARFAEAIPRFDIALKLSPHDERFLSARAWARAGEGTHLIEALADCNRALALKPDFSTAYDSRGLVYLRMGRYALAIRDYSKTLAAKPGRATALFGRGFAELRLNQTLAARRDIAGARKIDAEIDDIFVQVGILSAGCKEAHGPCALPDDLRSRTPAETPAYLSVRYRSAPGAHFIGDAEKMIRSIELSMPVSCPSCQVR